MQASTKTAKLYIFAMTYNSNGKMPCDAQVWVLISPYVSCYTFSILFSSEVVKTIKKKRKTFQYFQLWHGMFTFPWPHKRCNCGWIKNNLFLDIQCFKVTWNGSYLWTSFYIFFLNILANLTNICDRSKKLLINVQNIAIIKRKVCIVYKSTFFNSLPLCEL